MRTLRPPWWRRVALRWSPAAHRALDRAAHTPGVRRVNWLLQLLRRCGLWRRGGLQYWNGFSAELSAVYILRCFVLGHEQAQAELLATLNSLDAPAEQREVSSDLRIYWHTGILIY